MSRYLKELEKLDAEYAQRESGIHAAMGRINEAEALLESIKRHMPENPLLNVLVLSHRDPVEVELFAWGNFMDLFYALEKAGIEAKEVAPMDFSSGKSIRKFALTGFDVQICVEGEITTLPAERDALAA